MRALLTGDNLARAAAAALATGVACHPRLALWIARPEQLWMLQAVLMWVAWMLWSFVFAWYEPAVGAEPLRFRAERKVWIAALVSGVVLAVALVVVVDPVGRMRTPEDYPETPFMWLAMALFSMTFDQLFLCFAPFAFFVRLCRHITVAACLTVVLGLFVMAMKINSSPEPPPADYIVMLVVLRLVFGCFSLWLLVRGGILVVWLWALLLQARHLVFFLTHAG